MIFNEKLNFFFNILSIELEVLFFFLREELLLEGVGMVGNGNGR